MQGLRITTSWQPDWSPEFIGTLVFVVRQNDVLLIHKKTGHGAGKINGPGGKLDPGEGVIDCAIREVAEEVGLVITDPVVAVEMRFVERNGPQWLGFALVVTAFAGKPVVTREADPFWCPIDDVPYGQMWADDVIWLPSLLSVPQRAADCIHVWDFLFDDGKLLEHTAVAVPSIWQQVVGPDV